MHPDIESITAMLEEATILLRKHDIPHWADWLEKDARLIRGLDFYGIEHLLSAFGGMGSLNDLGLAKPSKGSPNILVASEDDARFQSLISNIYSLAKKLAREESHSRHRV